MTNYYPYQKEFAKIIQSKIDSNELLERMGLPLESLSLNELQELVAKVNNSLTLPPKNVGLYEADIYKDPALQNLLKQDLIILKEFQTLPEEKIVEIENKWLEILKYLNMQNASAATWENYHATGIQQYLEQSDNLDFHKYSLYIPQVYDEIIKNFNNKNSPCLLALGYNPLKSSVQLTCKAIAKINDRSYQINQTKILNFTKAKALHKLGFNFDWLMAIPSAFNIGTKEDNCLLASFYLSFESSYLDKSTRIEYLNFIIDASPLLKLPSTIDNIMSSIYKFENNGNNFDKDETKANQISFAQVISSIKDRLNLENNLSPALDSFKEKIKI